MYKKFIAAFLLICIQIGAVIFFQKSYILSDREQIELAPLPINSAGVIVPLDNRPPCLLFPVQLAHLGSMQLHYPAVQIMGNYQEKGKTNIIRTWLYDNTTDQEQLAIISTDMLVHGGLVASRESYEFNSETLDALAIMDKLHERYPQLFLSAFTVIPRLTIADNRQTSPWQWHMREYTVLQDIVNTFDNPIAFQKWQSFDKVIPASLKEKYQKLYATNNNFNKLIIQEFDKNVLSSLTIGQDDAAVFGLPNHNLHNAERYMPDSQPLAQVTRGADEIAQLLVAQYLNVRNNYTPLIFIKYSSPDTAYKIMPYMSCSVQESIEEKVAIIQGKLTNNIEQADFVLYVHCGEQQDSITKIADSAQEFKTLINRGYKVALVDLSRNFRYQDTLLPYLVLYDVPLAKLISYSGWNTTSNSIGTAVSQATIFTMQERLLPKTLLPNLYYQNLQFTLARLIDDWGYQKNIQHETNYNLLSRDLDPYRLAQQTQKTEDAINKQLNKIVRQLLYLNISRHAFYQTNEQKYFVTSIKNKVALPWQRTFEIKLSLTSTVGVQKTD